MGGVAMEPVDKAVCEAKCKVMDERFARDLRDIDDCKNRLKKIEELTIQMAELVKTSQEASPKGVGGSRRPADRAGTPPVHVVG